MSLVRAIEIYDAYRGAGAGVRLGTSRVRWAIESAVAAVFEVGIEELRAPTRGSARAAFARQVAMYLAHVGCGVSLTEVGRLFERDRTTVGKSASRSPVLRDITVSMWLTRHAGVERAFAIGEARTTGRRSIRGGAPAISEPWERSRWPAAHLSGSSRPWQGGRSSAAASGALSDAGG